MGTTRRGCSASTSATKPPVIAAVRVDPEEAGGLDGALQSLTTVPGGVIALLAIAVGLIVYGAYCVARGVWAR